MQKKQNNSTTFNDIFGGTTAMLIALPSAIAFGIFIFSPLGAVYSTIGAIGGILGTIAMSLTAPILGSTNRIVSSPCAPAAAVLSVFVTDMVKNGVPIESIPILITLVTLFTGLVQLLIGKIGGGTFIKYIPYPVVAGFMGAVGVLIVLAQLPKLIGLPDGVKLKSGLFNYNLWNTESIIIGFAAIVIMDLSAKYIKKLPAAIVALFGSIVVYFIIGIFDSSLLTLTNNKLVLGQMSVSAESLLSTVTGRWSLLNLVNLNNLSLIAAPVLTLAVLLSIDTLKTCLMLDSMTFTRHNSNNELIGQGLGNMASGVLCGIPGAGGTGPTMVNYNSGGTTKLSGFWVGIASIIVLLFLGKMFAWIPLPALSGIMIVMGVKMVDIKRFTLVKNKTTIFDFIVIFSVVISAIYFSLIVAAGVGIALAIFLFLKELINTSVIRRKLHGNEVFSKNLRTLAETKILEQKGSKTIVLELQGQLFFGTTDQLFMKLEPYFADCKYYIFDIHRVQSIDYTAVNMLKQILARIKDSNGCMIFVPMPLTLLNGQNVKEYFDFLGLSVSDNLKTFSDLETGLEWVENTILKEENITKFDEDKILELNEIEFFSNFDNEKLSFFKSCLEQKCIYEGEHIFRAGTISDEIYFVRKGTIKIILPLQDNKQFHLLTIGKGGIFGEMAFIDNVTRSADAVSVDTTYLYILSKEKFKPIISQHPETAFMFMEHLAFLIADRLRHSNKELKALQEN